MPIKTIYDLIPKNLIWDQIHKNQIIFQMSLDGSYYFKAAFDVSQVKWKTSLIPDLILLW